MYKGYEIFPENTQSFFNPGDKLEPAPNAVVISVPDDKARQAEKEVHGQEAMPDEILAGVWVNPLHEMENPNSHSRYPP